ncbi:hypothetical protein Tco_0192091, partial [Tanacetum coccineum]
KEREEMEGQDEDEEGPRRWEELKASGLTLLELDGS